MKVLVATEETQGHRKTDFCWTEEGELVFFGSECTRETIDGECGCRRSLCGLRTRKATTTFRVVEREEALAGRPGEPARRRPRGRALLRYAREGSPRGGGGCLPAGGARVRLPRGRNPREAGEPVPGAAAVGRLIGRATGRARVSNHDEDLRPDRARPAALTGARTASPREAMANRSPWRPSLEDSGLLHWSGNGIRTRDHQLGKQRRRHRNAPQQGATSGNDCKRSWARPAPSVSNRVETNGSC